MAQSDRGRHLTSPDLYMHTQGQTDLHFYIHATHTHTERRCGKRLTIVLIFNTDFPLMISLDCLTQVDNTLGSVLS